VRRKVLGEMTTTTTTGESIDRAMHRSVDRSADSDMLTPPHFSFTAGLGISGVLLTLPANPP
jgi:hypothetical protein